MASIIGTKFRTRFPGTVRGAPAPGPAYWQGQAAWADEVQQRLESGVFGVTVQAPRLLPSGATATDPILELDAGAFHRIDWDTANGPQFDINGGWKNGTVNIGRIYAGLPLPGGTTFSRLEWHVHLSTAVSMTLVLSTRSDAGAETAVSQIVTSLAVAGDFVLPATFATQTACKSANGIYSLHIRLDPDAGQTLAFRGLRIFA